MNTVENFLSENTLTNLKGKKMESPFNTYHPLDKGNMKLDKSILSFSLIPVVTCPVRCKGCYDLKSLRYPSVRMKRLYNTHLALNEPDLLKSLIIDQIKNSNTVKFIRIHVGGDFFNVQYVDMWESIIKEVNQIKPEIIFYTYTKTVFLERLKDIGINVIDSYRSDGKVNFDTLENLTEYVKENPEYHICPAYKHDPSIICGKTCKICMNKTKVLFVTH